MRLRWGQAGPELTARRVAITGLGVVSCCGVGKDAFWDGLCGPAPTGERRVVGFDPSLWFGPKEVRRVDRFGQLTVAAATMALDDAGPVHVDPERAGVVMGSAAVVLEDLERAMTRGARIYGEVTGAASTADAHHITIPAPGGSGAAACMELALTDADIGPGQIGHINAHGTSTPLNDAAEAE